MATLEDLAFQLSGVDAQKNIAADNPYTSFQSIPDSISGLITNIAAKGGGDYSLGSLIGASALSGLLGGGLQQLGNNYQTDKMAQYQDAFGKLIKGQDVGETDLSPNLLAKAKESANMFKLKQMVADAENEKALDMQVKKQVALSTNPDIIGAEVAKQKMLQAINPPANPLQNEIVKETSTVKKAQNANDYADKIFNDAKKLVGYGAYFDGTKTGLPSAAGAQLQAGNAALLLHIDNSLGESGREINDQRVKELKGLTPQWYDSPEKVAEKQERFKELLSGLMKPTPVLDSLGVDTKPKSRTIETPKTSIIGPDGNEYIFTN